MLACLFTTSTVHAVLPEIIGIIKCDTTHTRFGEGIVGLGDQNLDGYADLMIWDYRFRASVFLGGPTLSNLPALAIGDVLPPKVSRDVNFDGAHDVVMKGRLSFGLKLNTYFGGLLLDTARDQWFGLDTMMSGAAYCAGLNVDGSGTIGIWSSSAPDQQRRVLHFSLSAFSDSTPDVVIIPPAASFLRRYADGIISNDFNGDGYPDLIFNARGSWADSVNGSVLVYFGGPAFDTLADFTIYRPGSFQDCYDQFGMVLVDLGDCNGDGFDDMFVGHGQSCDTVGFVYFGGPSLDSVPDILIPDATEQATNAGDVNGDGYPDLVTSLSIASSSYSYVNIYYGGPTADSLPDLVIDVKDAPGYNIVFGMGIAGLGDVDGDGIDDFAVASQDDFGYGQVYVFAGKSSGSGVRARPEQSLPTDFVLHQNYPNPFNPSTTIAFDLAQKSPVSLLIYNVVGQRVRTLVNQELSAGSFESEWDGKDDSGRPTASGIYFYSLRTETTFESKKMVLLK
ncbi:MAG: FlgD immunoglobulin-like domain containing protein [Candidatus Zixiibacteriota bacterium]